MRRLGIPRPSSRAKKRRVTLKRSRNVVEREILILSLATACTAVGEEMNGDDNSWATLRPNNKVAHRAAEI